MGINAASRRGTGLEALLKVSNKLASAEAKFIATKRLPGISKRKILQGLWATLMGVAMFVFWKRVSNIVVADLQESQEAWPEDGWGVAGEGAGRTELASHTVKSVDRWRGARPHPPFSNSNNSQLAAWLHSSSDVREEEEEGVMPARDTELGDLQPHSGAQQGLWPKSKAGFRATGRSGGLANSGWSRLPRLRDGRDWREAIDGEDDDELEERDSRVHNFTLPPRSMPQATNHSADAVVADAGTLAGSGSLHAVLTDSDAAAYVPGHTSPPWPRHRAPAASAADSKGEPPRAAMRFAEAALGMSERRRVKIKLPDGRRMSGRLLTEGAPGGFGVMVKTMRDAATGRDQVVIVKIPYVAPAEALPLPPGGVRHPPSTPRGVGMGQLEFEHFAAATLRSAALCAFVVKYDNLVQCPEWIQLGECSRNPSFMMLNCAASCCGLTKPHNKQQSKDAAHHNMKVLQPLHIHPLEHQPEVKTAEAIVADTKAMSKELQHRANERSHMLEYSGHKEVHPSELASGDEEVKESGLNAQMRMRYHIDRQHSLQKNMQVLTAATLEAMKEDNRTLAQHSPNANVHSPDKADFEDDQPSLSLGMAASNTLRRNDPDHIRDADSSGVSTEAFKLNNSSREINSENEDWDSPTMTQVMVPKLKHDGMADGLDQEITIGINDPQSWDSVLLLASTTLDTAANYAEGVIGMGNSSVPASNLSTTDNTVEAVETIQGSDLIDIGDRGMSPEEVRVVRAGQSLMSNKTGQTSSDVDVTTVMSTKDTRTNDRRFGLATGQSIRLQDSDGHGQGTSAVFDSGESKGAFAIGNTELKAAVIQRLDARQKEHQQAANHLAHQKVEQDLIDFDA